jgi:hypothetical protein
MKNLLGLACAGALALAGCAQPIKTVWLRTDGQNMRANPTLVQQFEVDQTICAGETSKANMSGTAICRGASDCLITSINREIDAKSVAQGCMAQKGYLNVPEDQAEAKAAELRALQPPAPAPRTARR